MGALKQNIRDHFLVWKWPIVILNKMSKNYKGECRQLITYN